MNLKGGKGKIIPEYTESINSPYITTNEKNIHNANKPVPTIIPGVPGGPSSMPIQQPYAQNQNKGQDKILLDLQVYQDTKKPNPLADKQGMIPLPPLSLSSPFMPPQFQNYFNNFMKNFYTPFIYKDYHINIGGPNANHIQASMIYEDSLPPIDIYSSYKSLKERNSLSDYIRGTFITVEEGELVDFSGNKNSLNSRLKLIELNPYNTNNFSDNPYTGLPESLMIYKSCYPIVYDKKEATTQCSKSSVGITMRVYKITLEEIKSKFGSNTTIMKGLVDLVDKITPKEPILYDIWREIDYYAYIRDVINKNYICPNFVKSYCYFINKNANMTFIKNGQKFVKNDEKIVDNTFSNTTLIILAESPNQNFQTWASNIYVKSRNVNTLVYSGFKSDNIWETIISQILIAFYIMNKYKFTFELMTLESNFYVKDINVYGDQKQYWKYRINGLDYFIPNFGHLLMVDHNYKDLPIERLRKKYKIYSKDLFGDNSNLIEEKIRDNAINCINPNNFGSEFKKNNGVPPTGNIINLLSKINEDLKEKKTNTDGSVVYKNSFNDLIEKYLIKYIHNRTGSMIRDLEINYVRKNDIKPFKKGELVIYEERFDTYQILLYLYNENEQQCKCITKEKNEYAFISVNKDLIYHYSEYDTIKQDIKLGEPAINFDYIIESYEI